MAAAFSDFLLALLLSGLTASTLGQWCAERAVHALAIDDPGSWWRGPVPMVLGILGNLVYSLPVTVLVVTLSRPLFGRTPGQSWWGLPADGSEAWLRWLDDHAPAFLLVLALVAGDVRLTVLALAGIALWGVRRGLRQARTGVR